MATGWFAGVDVEAQFGFYLSSEGDVYDKAVLVPAEVEIPGVVGSFFTGPGRLGSRDFKLKGFFDGASKAAVLANVKAFASLISDGIIPIRLADWSDVMIEAKLVAFPGSSMPPEQVQIPFDVELTFRAPVPFWRDVNALCYRFDANPTPMPCGNASVAPELYGCATGGASAVTPQLKGYDHRGNEEWSATFATLAAGEAYKLVTAAFDMGIYKKAAGSAVWVAQDDQTILTAGVFPKALFSSSAAYRMAQWAMLSGSTGKWVAIYPRTWW